MARGAAAWGAAAQRGKGYPKSDHEAASEADQVEDFCKEAYSEADQGGGKTRTNPMMMNQASAEALPKFFFPLAAATNPMKNQADTEALPKFSSAASAGSSEEDKLLDDVRMAKLEWHMTVRGTTAARFA